MFESRPLARGRLDRAVSVKVGSHAHSRAEGWHIVGVVTPTRARKAGGGCDMYGTRAVVTPTRARKAELRHLVSVFGRIVTPTFRRTYHA